MKTFNGIFHDLSFANKEIAELEKQIVEKRKFIEKKKKDILNNVQLHDVLTTVGVIHEGEIFRKRFNESKALGIPTPTVNGSKYHLKVDLYAEPINSYQLDARLNAQSGGK